MPTPRAPMTMGSSPLARGLLRSGSWLLRGLGIIPARAGFTTCPSPASASSADHPRSRGVYTRSGPCTGRPSGSSPLARGLHNSLSLGPDDLRIIPARAGFTRPVHAGDAVNGDHPRSRGVYVRRDSVCWAVAGSSPLARGLPDRVNPQGEGVGIIPARAGFTLRVAGRPQDRGDHPRSRGVYTG